MGNGGSQLEFGAQLPNMAMELRTARGTDTEHRHQGAGEETDVLCWKPLAGAPKHPGVSEIWTEAAANYV